MKTLLTEATSAKEELETTKAVLVQCQNDLSDARAELVRQEDNNRKLSEETALQHQETIRQLREDYDKKLDDFKVRFCVSLGKFALKIISFEIVKAST